MKFRYVILVYEYGIPCFALDLAEGARSFWDNRIWRSAPRALFEAKNAAMPGEKNSTYKQENEGHNSYDHKE